MMNQAYHGACQRLSSSRNCAITDSPSTPQANNAANVTLCPRSARHVHDMIDQTSIGTPKHSTARGQRGERWVFACTDLG